MSDDELKSLFQGMRQDIAGIREDVVGIREENAGMRQDIDAVRQENTAAHAETRRHFGIVGEASKHETMLVAEGVALTRELLNREATDIREEVRRTASETQAMINFSHAEARSSHAHA